MKPSSFLKTQTLLCVLSSLKGIIGELEVDLLEAALGMGDCLHLKTVN